jgi:hypothetical protein
MPVGSPGQLNATDPATPLSDVSISALPSVYSGGTAGNVGAQHPPAQTNVYSTSYLSAVTLATYRPSAPTVRPTAARVTHAVVLSHWRQYPARHTCRV